jgi:beta-xylosidase
VWIDLPGIDPDLAWDDDGTYWVALAGVGVARIDPATGKVLEGPAPVRSGSGKRDPEGPHLYRIRPRGTSVQRISVRTITVRSARAC